MINLYLDMDGTLAEYNEVPVEKFYEPGFFENLKPMENVIKGIEIFARSHPDINLYVLSAIMTEYAKTEKENWIEMYCPFLKDIEKYFIPFGCDKGKYVGDGINFLLDDHSPNLISFEQKDNNHAIKLLNGKNGLGKKWTKAKIDGSLKPEAFANHLFEYINSVAV